MESNNNKDAVLYFISLVRERPAIWDSMCKDHKNKNKKYDAVEEIALLTGYSVKTVNTKWASLRNQFSREKRNMTGTRTGSGADAIYHTKWYAYKDMESLMDCNTPNMTYNNLTYAESPDESVPPPPQLLLRPSFTPSPPPLRPSSTPSPPLRPSYTPSPQRPSSTPTSPLLQPPSSVLHSTSSTEKRKKIYRNTVYKEALQTLQAIRQKKNEPLNKEPSSFNTDELTSSYGLYIAAHLKKFNPRLQCKARYEINNILYMLDMESLNSSASDSSVGGDYQCMPDLDETIQQQATTTVPNVHIFNNEEHVPNFYNVHQQIAPKVQILSNEEYTSNLLEQQQTASTKVLLINNEEYLIDQEDETETAVSYLLNVHKK